MSVQIQMCVCASCMFVLCSLDDDKYDSPGVAGGRESKSIFTLSLLNINSLPAFKNIQNAQNEFIGPGRVGSMH